MKYLVFILCLLFFVTGCSSEKPDIYSRIENEEYLSIHYPITQNQVVDQKIEEYVEKKYQEYTEQFPTASEKEYNVDFRYHFVDNRFDSVLLKVFYMAPSMAHPVIDGETWNYDREKKQFLTLEDLVPKEKFPFLIDKIKKELLETHSDCIFKEELDRLLGDNFEEYSFFTFNNENLTIYFHPYKISAGVCGILEVSIPWKEISPLLPIKENKEPVFLPINSMVEKVIDPNKPVIAFTFDDGPSNYTKEIAELLKSFEGSGTFFVVGNKVEFHQEVLRSLVANGNEIGNHSYNHQWMSRMSEKEFKEQIEKTQQIIKKTTGFEPIRIRPTYGSMSDKIRKNTTLKVSLWNIDPKDWKYKDAKTIAKRILDKVQDGKVVLLHDTHYRSYEALKIVLPKLKEAGYQFVTLSELEEIELLREQAKKNTGEI